MKLIKLLGMKKRKLNMMRIENDDLVADLISEDLADSIEVSEILILEILISEILCEEFSVADLVADQEQKKLLDEKIFKSVLISRSKNHISERTKKYHIVGWKKSLEYKKKPVNSVMDAEVWSNKYRLHLGLCKAHEHVQAVVVWEKYLWKMEDYLLNDD